MNSFSIDSLAKVNQFLQLVCVSDVAYLRNIAGDKTRKHATEVPLDQDTWDYLLTRPGFLAVAANWCNDNDTSLGGKSFTIEFDEDSSGNTINPEQQIQWMAEAGLPYSLAVFTGGKSVHFWVVLEQPVEELKWKALVNGYLSKLSEVAGIAKADESSLKIAQVYRLPYVMHQKTGKHSEILEHLSNWQKFTYDELEYLSKPLAKAGQKNKSRSTASVANSLSELASEIATYSSVLGEGNESYQKKAQRSLSNAIAGIKRGKGAETAVWSACALFAPAAVAMGAEAAVEHIMNLLEQHFTPQDNERGYEWNRDSYRQQIIRGLSHGLAESKEQLEQYDRVMEGEQVKERYVSNLNVVDRSGKLAFVKSAVGTGKTQAIVQAIAKLPYDARVLIVAHRVALVQQWISESTKHKLGLLDYSDPVVNSTVLNLSSVQRLVITTDSLHRFLTGNSFNGTYDLVVLDECDQLLEHLLTATGTHIRNNRLQTLRVLQGVLTNSTKVLSASAHLSNLEVDVVKTLANTSDATAIINTEVPNKRQYELLATEADAVAKMQELLETGDNIFICCDSREKALDLHKLLKKSEPLGACITATNVGDYERELQNLEPFVEQLRYLIASPTLGTGFDIANKHFHSIIGVFTNARDLGFLSLEQALSRVRYPKNEIAYVFVDPKAHWRDCSPEFVGEMYRVRESALSGDYCLEVDPVTCEVRVPAFTRQVQEWQELYLSRHVSETVNRKVKLKQALVSRGHKVTEVSSVFTKVDLPRAERKLEEAEAILAASVITKETYDALQKKRMRRENLTQEQNDAIARYQIADALSTEELTLADVQWWMADGKAIARLYKLKNTPDEVARKWDELEIQATQQNGGLGAHFNYSNKQALTATLDAASTVLSKGKYTSDDLTEFAEVTLANVVPLKALGISVDKRSACKTMKSLLTMLEYSVDSDQVRVGSKRQWVYTIYRTEQQQRRVAALEPSDELEGIY